MMEPGVGEPASPGCDGSNLLGLPSPCFWEDEDEPLDLGGIKPKSSPIPRRRSSLSSCSDDDSQPPPSSSRRVSFADAFGLSLVSVKEFDTWATCGNLGTVEGDPSDGKEYFLSLRFSLSPTPEKLLRKIQEQKVELESLELLSGTTTLKGIVRVLNLCFDKLVYIRTSLDCWRSHFDLLAEYVPGSSDITDCFSFKLTLVPPFGEQGARVDFCLRYETPLGSFWANNGGENYVLFCHEKVKEQDEDENKQQRKSCLKSNSTDYSSKTSSTSSTGDIPEIILNCGMAAATKPVALNEDRKQREYAALQEENNRNRIRRNRRRAARQAKVQQYFAQREEKDLQRTERDNGKETADTTSDENDSVEGEELSHFQTSQKSIFNVDTDMDNSVSPSPAKIPEQLLTLGITDTDFNQVPTGQIQKQDEEIIPLIQSELTSSRPRTKQSPPDSEICHESSESSVSQTSASSQNKERASSQTVSIQHHFNEGQNSDTSISTSVEKAWECFEKGTMERISGMSERRLGKDVNTSVGKTDHWENSTVKNNTDIEPFGQRFTFETIVAPLYHQVFERMENKRRDLVNRTLSAGESGGKVEDGRVVTYQSYPRTQSVETKSNAEMPENHMVNDAYHGNFNISFPQDLQNAKNTSQKPLYDSVNSNLVPEMGVSVCDQTSADITEDLLDTDISETKITQVSKKDYLLCTLSFQEKCSIKSTPTQENLERQTPSKTVSENINVLAITLEELPFSELSSDNLQQELSPSSSIVLTTQSNTRSTADMSPSTVSENPVSMNNSFIQISSENSSSTESNTLQSMKAELCIQSANFEENQTFEEPHFIGNENIVSLNNGSKPLNETHIPIPQSALIDCHISSNVTPSFSQSEALTLPQNLPVQATIQIQSPDIISCNHIQKSDAITTVQFQITGNANVSQESESMPGSTDDNDDSYRVCNETDSNTEERIESESLNSAIETTQAEETNINPEEETLCSTSLTHLQISQINEDKEDLITKFDFSKSVIAFNGAVSENAKAETRANETVMKGQKDVDIVEEEKQVDDLRNNDQMEDHQSPVQVSELTVKTWKVEKGEKDDEDRHHPQQQHDNCDINLENEDGCLNELQYIDDDDEVVEEDNVDTKQNFEEQWEGDDHLSLEVEIEEQKVISRVGSVVTVESSASIESFPVEGQLHLREERQCTSRNVEQKSDNNVNISEEEKTQETNPPQQALTENNVSTFSDTVEETFDKSLRKQQTVQLTIGEVSKPPENQEEQHDGDKNELSDNNMEDSESLTDDEMELYLHRLKNTQQSMFRDGVSNMNYSKRPSLSRTRSLPSPMPSISESVDEDQPKAESLDDLTNEEMLELERATLPLVDLEEDVIGRNVQWWRDFFSSDNMLRMTGYTFFFIVFVITAYFYDFIACFGVYILAVYWLYIHGEREPLKRT